MGTRVIRFARYGYVFRVWALGSTWYLRCIGLWDDAFILVERDCRYYA